MASPQQILLLVETSRVFGRGIIEGISRYAKERADWQFHFEDRGLLESPPSWLDRWQGDGIISRSASSALMDTVRRFRCPSVELLGDGTRHRADVCTNEVQSAELAIAHLLKQGFENLAFYSFANSWWSDSRRIAFEENLRARHLPANVYPGAYEGRHLAYPTWKPSFHRPLVRWIEQLPKPVGIWAVADSQAIRVIEACRDIQVHIPSDVGVLGTSNEDIVCSMLTPSISSIELNPQEVGYKAASLLDMRMRNRKSQIKTATGPILVSPTQVVVRQSSDRLAIIDPEIAQAIEIIEREAAVGLTVDQLAEEMLISRSTLERRFRDRFHCSPAQEINRIRIERAKGILRETAWPIHVISQKTGFSSAENFVRFFRRLVGKTPRQYRHDHFGTF